MSYMTVPQANIWLSKLENPGKWGWKTTHDKIATYLLKSHKQRIRGHKDADGNIWPKIYVPPKPRVGQKAPILLDSGKIVTETIRTSRGKRRNTEYRKKAGIPIKKMQSLYRPRVPEGYSKKLKATKIWDVLSTRGRSVRTSKYEMQYGFTPGTEWVKTHQFGGAYHGKQVPKREIVGMNDKDIFNISAIYKHDMMRKLERGLK